MDRCVCDFLIYHTLQRYWVWYTFPYPKFLPDQRKIMQDTANLMQAFGLTNTTLNLYFGVGAHDAVFYFGDDTIETYLEDTLASYGADFELAFSNRAGVEDALWEHLYFDYLHEKGYSSDTEYHQNTVFSLLGYVDFDVVSDTDVTNFIESFRDSFL